MSAFKVFENLTDSRDSFPYLLEVQSELLVGLSSTVVIPLVLRSSLGPKLIKNLNPTLRVGGVEHVALTQQLASIPRTILGKELQEVLVDRVSILSSIDFLITGV